MPVGRLVVALLQEPKARRVALSSFFFFTVGLTSDGDMNLIISRVNVKGCERGGFLTQKPPLRASRVSAVKECPQGGGSRGHRFWNKILARGVSGAPLDPASGNRLCLRPPAL